MIVVYAKESCYPCAATRRALERAGLSRVDGGGGVAGFVVRDLADEGNLDRARALGFSQAPVVEVDCPPPGVPRAWSGYRPDYLRAVARAALGSSSTGATEHASHVR